MNDRESASSRTAEHDRWVEGTTTDQLFVVLSDPVRRTVLRSLGPPEQAARTPEELIDVVLTRLYDPRPPDVIPDREEVASSFYHVHLPKLRQAGIVVKTDEGIEETCPDVVWDLLDAVDAHERERRE